MSEKVLPPNISVTLSLGTETEGENLTFGPCNTCSYRDVCYQQMTFCRPDLPEQFYREIKGCTNWTDNPDVYEEYKMSDEEKEQVEKDLKNIENMLKHNVVEEDKPYKMTGFNKARESADRLWLNRLKWLENCTSGTKTERADCLKENKSSTPQKISGAKEAWNIAYSIAKKQLNWLRRK